jgi:hypothetical protein
MCVINLFGLLLGQLVGLRQPNLGRRRSGTFPKSVKENISVYFSDWAN